MNVHRSHQLIRHNRALQLLQKVVLPDFDITPVTTSTYTIVEADVGKMKFMMPTSGICLISIPVDSPLSVKDTVSFLLPNRGTLRFLQDAGNPGDVTNMPAGNTVTLRVTDLGDFGGTPGEKGLIFASTVKEPGIQTQGISSDKDWTGERLVLVNSSGGILKLTIPPDPGFEDGFFHVLDIGNATSNAITVEFASGTTLDGNAGVQTRTISTDYGVLTFYKKKNSATYSTYYDSSIVGGGGSLNELTLIPPGLAEIVASFQIKSFVEVLTFSGGAREQTSGFIPTGAVLLGARTKNNSLITGGGGATNYTIAYSGGATQNISSAAILFVDNDESGKNYDSNLNSPITSAKTYVEFTPNVGTLDSGDVEIVVWYYDMLTK